MRKRRTMPLDDTYILTLVRAWTSRGNIYQAIVSALVLSHSDYWCYRGGPVCRSNQDDSGLYSLVYNGTGFSMYIVVDAFNQYGAI